ncbi:MAG: DUF2232 domain-containing protein [Thomasclavelia sp.]|nr:DUF2232 domain-containing protein [Thomasclavelia sp.]
MNNTKTKMITTGGMLSALFGVLGMLNVLTGTTFDMYISYFIAVITCMYNLKYDYKAALGLTITTWVVLFMIGELFFMAFTGTTMLMGVYLGYAYKREINQKVINWGLRIISMIKNFIIFYLLGSLFGIDLINETKDMIKGFVHLSSDIPIIISMIIVWIVIGFIEGYIIKMITLILNIKLDKHY